MDQDTIRRLWDELGLEADEGPCPADRDEAVGKLNHALRNREHQRRLRQQLGWPEPRRADETGNGVSVSRGDWRVRIKGLAAIAAVFLALLAVGGYKLYEATAAATSVEHGRIVVAQQALADEFRYLSYILSLPQNERPRLIPPPGLLDRVDRGGGGRR